LYDVIYFCYSP